MHVIPRRWFPAVTIASLLLTFSLTAAAATKYASIVVDADSGRVLHATNPDARNYPASLTKMMTLYLLFEAIEQNRYQMSSPLTVSPRASAAAPSKLGLRPRSTITVNEAIQAIVTKSANDVAVTIGENLGGTEAKFALLMTAKAHELGMRHTTFKNASGLPSKTQFSSARDMAILARRLQRDFPQHYRFFALTEFARGNEVYRTHNNLLLSYEGADGIKTGFTVASGFNLVASAHRDGKRLIGVVFGGNSARTRDAHMADLLDAGFAEMNGNTGMLAAAPLLEDLESQTPMPVFASANITGVGDIDVEEPPATRKTAQPAVAAAPVITDPARLWGIQVGAYGSQAKASEAANLARTRLSATYPDTIVRIEKAPWKGGFLFRAQVIGLKKGDIDAACTLAGIETKIGCKQVALPQPKKTKTAKR